MAAPGRKTTSGQTRKIQLNDKYFPEKGKISIMKTGEKTNCYVNNRKDRSLCQKCHHQSQICFFPV